MLYLQQAGLGIRIRIQFFTWMLIGIRLLPLMLIRIRILLLIKVMRICDHWYTDPACRAPFRASTPPLWASTAIHCSIFSILNSSILTLICGSGSATLPVTMRLLRRWNLTILSDKLVSKKKICNSPDKIDSPVSSSSSLQELLRMNVSPEMTNLHKENETEKRGDGSATECSDCWHFLEWLGNQILFIAFFKSVLITHSFKIETLF